MWVLPALLGVLAIGPSFPPSLGGVWADSGLEGATHANLSTSGSDWPTFLHDSQRSSNNPVSSTLSAASAKSIHAVWNASTHGVIAASTTVVNGVAYVGSWDGYEYAFNVSDGSRLWRTYLGTYVACHSTLGVTSTSTVENGIVYLGGGDTKWYALNASNGTPLWNVTVDTAKGSYNWGSPLLANGWAYVGLASGCDQPLIPGALLQINLSTHRIDHRFNTTFNGSRGSTVWASPTLDAATNTVFIATGNSYVAQTLSPDQPYQDSILALNATNLSLEGYWRVPVAAEGVDKDFGATPSLATTSSGITLVIDESKNGFVYALNASNASTPGWAPVWQTKVSNSETTASGTVIGRLYVVGSANAWLNTSTSSRRYQGAVWALDVDNGSTVWEESMPGRVYEAAAYENGLVVAAGGHSLVVFKAQTGARLYHFTCSAPYYASVSIAENLIFEGCTNGVLTAFGVGGTGGGGGHLPFARALPLDRLVARPRW